MAKHDCNECGHNYRNCSCSLTDEQKKKAEEYTQNLFFGPDTLTHKYKIAIKKLKQIAYYGHLESSAIADDATNTLKELGEI